MLLVQFRLQQNYAKCSEFVPLTNGFLGALYSWLALSFVCTLRYKQDTSVWRGLRCTIPHVDSYYGFSRTIGGPPPVAQALLHVGVFTMLVASALPLIESNVYCVSTF